jgi:hypothetical protein
MILDGKITITPVAGEKKMMIPTTIALYLLHRQ